MCKYSAFLLPVICVGSTLVVGTHEEEEEEEVEEEEEEEEEEEDDVENFSVKNLTASSND